MKAILRDSLENTSLKVLEMGSAMGDGIRDKNLMEKAEMVIECLTVYGLYPQ